MDNDRKPYENVSRVFWIRIELEEKSQRGRQFFGEIRDAISGKRSPIKDLFDIIRFIIPYLQEMGARIGWFWQLVNWMNGKKNSRRPRDGKGG